MIDREPSRFRFTPFGKYWRSFRLEVPDPFRRLSEWFWSKRIFRRAARTFDHQLMGPTAGDPRLGLPAMPGRSIPILSDDEYSLDDDEKAVHLHRLRSRHERPRYESPEAAALAEWDWYPSAKARLVEVRFVDARTAIVVTDTDPSHPMFNRVQLTANGWEFAGDSN